MSIAEEKEPLRYSKLELKILKNIPTDGTKISTIDLTIKCYTDNKRPIYARQSILDAANKLITKSDENEEEWEIFKSSAKGSQPVYFWREERKRKE